MNPKKLTNKQKKEFIRLWIGNMLFHQDFGFEDTDICEEDIISLEQMKLEMAYKYLKDDRSVGTTNEIFKHVQLKK